LTSQKLLATPIPYEDESSGSVLLRASSKNGIKKPSNLISRFYEDDRDNPTPSNVRSLLSKESYYINMCNSLAIKVDRVEVLKPCRTNDRSNANFIFNGIEVHRNNIRLTQPALCPLCISELGYMKRVWDHRFVTTCTIHNILLIETCSKCSSPITWDRTEVNRCKCGTAFDKAKLTPANSSYTSATQIIESIFHRKSQAEYDQLMDFLIALKAYFRAESIYDLDLLVLAVMGLTQPSELERNLYIDIMSDIKFAHYHPRIIMTDFLLAATQVVRDVGENIVDRLFDMAQPIKEVTNEKDCVSVVSAANSLGLTKNDILKLIKRQSLTGYKSKPASRWLVTKKSVNDLVLKIDSLSVSSTKSLATLQEIEDDKQYETSIATLIVKIINNEISPIGFNYRDPLSLIKVIKPKRKQAPKIIVTSLVTPMELALFCKAPLNTVRLSFQSSGKYDYFNEGVTFGSQRYIRLEDAKTFAIKYLAKKRRTAKHDVMMETPFSDLKTVDIRVAYHG